jgi:phosphoserine phosphatase
MRGELDYEDSLRERVALFEGLDVRQTWQGVKHKITIRRGFLELFKICLEQGIATVIVSGGFIEIVNWIKVQVGAQYAYGNMVLILCYFL